MREVHYNRTQLLASTIQANKQCIIAPRGDGKTEGILAPQIIRDAINMPRSLQVLCHRDFESILTKTLPPLISGFRRLGYIKDIHYIIGKTAPHKWRRYGKWQLPYFEVQKAEHFIHFFNGAGVQLVSFNRDNSANGMSSDAIKNDETKTLTNKYKQRFDEELVPAMRGNREHFQHYSGWQGISFITDQPTSAAAKWIYEIESEMDPLQIEVIKGVQYEIAALRLKRRTAPKARLAALDSKINRLLVELNEFRMNSVFFYEAPPLQNLEVLGEETYKRWLNTLPWPVFRSSILNERLVEVADGFYSALDDEHHVIDYRDTYLEENAYNANYAVESLVRNNSKHDPDINPDEPLELGIDWGDSINTLVAAQDFGEEYHISKAMFVKKPDRIQDLAIKFCDYYRHHRCKHVVLPYDQTAHAGHGATNTTYLEGFIQKLYENGWSVEQINIGRTRSPQFRYTLSNNLLLERDPSLPKLRFNRHGTEHLIISMQQTQSKQTRRGIEKDKTAERKRLTFAQENAPHFSDGLDTLLVYKFEHIMSGLYDRDTII